MYKSILVAIDDSDLSIQVLYEAIKLSKEQQGKLHIVHVVDEYYVDYVGLGIDYERLEASLKDYGLEILKKMEDIARQSKADFDSQLIEVKTYRGRISEKIIDAAKKCLANLIVIGTHGRRGFHHFLLGSVAEEVIRIAPIPVLLIRGEQPTKL